MWQLNDDRIRNSVNYFFFFFKKKKICLVSLRLPSLTCFTPACCCCRMPVASCWSMESRSQMGCVCISLSNTLTLVLVPWSPSNAGYCRHTALISPSILQRTKQGMGVVGCLCFDRDLFLCPLMEEKTDYRLAPSNGQCKTYRGSLEMQWHFTVHEMNRCKSNASIKSAGNTGTVAFKCTPI